MASAVINTVDREINVFNVSVKNAGPKRERNTGVGVVKLIIIITMITTILIAMLIMIILRILIIMIIVIIVILQELVIIMTTMITVTIVITCFLQYGACSCQNTWETPRKTRTLYRTALSQPVRERASIFTLYLITFLTSAQRLRHSLLTSKDWAGFRCLDSDHFTATYLPKPPVSFVVRCACIKNAIPQMKGNYVR